MNSNILISSAGKRVELLLEFQRELRKAVPGGRVIAVDLNPAMSPACHVADAAFAVPRVTDPGFSDSLLDICLREGVRLVIPTIDTELAVLARERRRFAAHGIEIMVSDPEFIATCRDKRLTMRLFEQLGIRNPAPRDKHHPVFPMFAKPYDGSLSANIHILRSPDELTAEIMANPKLMFMEYIDRSVYKEYTVDLYYGADGCVRSIVPRERIEIRSGEVNKGAARKNYLVDYLRSRMGRLEGVRGCICVQLFHRPADNDVAGIEINPRYGGGYPLSYYAGANFPAAMIAEYILGTPPPYSDDWTDNTLMLRFDSQVIVRPGD